MVTPAPSRYASVETLLAAWLKATLGYENVAHELPTNLVFLMPLIVVDRFGGNDDTITIDRANVDIDCFAPTRVDALAHGEHIRKAMRTQLPRTVLGGATTVLKVETLSAPTAAAFDSKNTVRRCTASYRVHLHQFTGV